MQLTTIFPIEAGESSLGYYRRLAESNALWGWHELASTVGVARSRAGMFSNPEAVASQLGLDPAWTREASAREDVCRSWRGVHRSGGDAVCPLCLAEDKVLPLAWENRLVTACTKHHVQLVDRCHSCNERLLPGRPQVAFCACGADLTQFAARPATGGQRWLSRLIAKHGEEPDGTWPAVSDCDAVALAKVIRRLCVSSAKGAAPAARTASLPASVDDAAEFFRPLDTLLSDWPRSFDDHVRQRLAAADPSSRTLTKALGPWYQQIKAAAGTGPLRLFLDAIHRVAFREFDGMLGFESPPDEAGLGGPGGHVLPKNAAATLGVSRDTVIKAYRQGVIGGRSRRSGTRGMVHELLSADVERVRAARAQWISEKTAASMLAVPPSVVSHFVEAGCIEADANWRADISKGGTVSRLAVVKLAVTLRTSAHGLLEQEVTSGPSVLPKKGDTTIALREISGRKVGDRTALGELLRAIASGELKPVSGGPEPGKLRYLMTDVSRYFARPVLDAGLTLTQLAQLTGWKHESIAHWIAEGLLQAHAVSVRGQPCRVVTPEQLLAFRRKYIPLSDVAQAVGRRPSNIIRRLNGLEVYGAKAEPKGARRGGLLKVADLAYAALDPDRVSSEVRMVRECMAHGTWPAPR